MEKFHTKSQSRTASGTYNMALPVDEIDGKGRAIFYKGQADISKAVLYDNYDICTQERINDLYDRKKTPTPKFHTFVYSYAPYINLCAHGSNEKQKVKQRIEYGDITAVYPCVHDCNVLFMVTRNFKSKSNLRVFRLPNVDQATQLRYVIDQLQLNPMYETVGNLGSRSSRNTNNSFDSFRTVNTDDGDSVTSAAAIYHKTAAFGSAINQFDTVKKDYNLPRVQPYDLGPPHRGYIINERAPIKTIPSRHPIQFDQLYDSDIKEYRPKNVNARQISSSSVRIRQPPRDFYENEKDFNNNMKNQVESWRNGRSLRPESSRRRIPQYEDQYSYEEPPSQRNYNSRSMSRLRSSSPRKFRNY